MLQAHNSFRAQHGIAPLTYSTTIGQQASAWASNLASRGCSLQHGDHDGLGQNLYMIGGSYHVVQPMQDMFSAWSSESVSGNEYNHATQALWFNTKSVGCAIQWGNGGNCEVLVCNYSPPGNMMGLRFDGSKI
ncbi:allergen V5/Tpx-1 related [Obelidium mucronatum]|nr:allergen V5/Tpx-1 related [Obelidium mucronatum]